VPVSFPRSLSYWCSFVSIRGSVFPASHFVPPRPAVLFALSAFFVVISPCLQTRHQTPATNHIPSIRTVLLAPRLLACPDLFLTPIPPTSYHNPPPPGPPDPRTFPCIYMGDHTMKQLHSALSNKYRPVRSLRALRFNRYVVHALACRDCTRNPNPGTTTHSTQFLLLTSIPSTAYRESPPKKTVIFGPETVKNGHEIAQNRPQKVKKGPQLVTVSLLKDPSPPPKSPQYANSGSTLSQCQLQKSRWFPSCTGRDRIQPRFVTG
jgi:hypothetical protein